jgi:hypothetical protein
MFVVYGLAFVNLAFVDVYLHFKPLELIEHYLKKIASQK